MITSRASDSQTYLWLKNHGSYGQRFLIDFADAGVHHLLLIGFKSFWENFEIFLHSL